jgi:hypothetical protein
MPDQTLANNILMRSIKIVDIGYITVIYIIFSISIATFVDTWMGSFDPKAEEKKGFWQQTGEIILFMWSYGVLIYFVRNIVELIPFPLDGYQGFEHRRVKELKSAMVFTFTFILFCDYIKKKMLFYYKNTIRPFTSMNKK